MKKITIGIDIGGINTVIGVVTCDGELLCQSSIKTSDYPLYQDYQPYFDALCDAMRSLLKTLGDGYQLVGIGVGAPNANIHSGCVEKPANLWRFSAEQSSADPALRIFPLAQQLRAQFPMVEAVAITNDASAATIGEMLFGAARGLKDFVMITLGTGLGSGFVAGGQMIYGHDGFAGEFGHVIVERGGRKCGCGREGCLETYVSATGIKRTAIELMARTTHPSSLRDVSYNELTSLMLSQAAQQGDILALEAFECTGQVLGRALADVCTITSPEAIILFGGLAKAGELLFEPTRRSMEQNMMYPFKGKVKILASGLQDKNAAVIGAAALVWQQMQ